MPSELDRRFDEMLARVTGPGGRLVIEHDPEGRAIVGNFPPTLPGLFRAFCELYGDSREAMVAGEERLTFADLDRHSEEVAKALAGRGIVKGDRVGIAMRNCPSWVVAYMGAVKAGAVAVLLNGWWQKHELQHALELTEPALVIADGPRAALCSRAAQSNCCSMAQRPGSCPKSCRRTMRRSSSPLARPAKRKAPCRPTAR
jgi:long-subunit acyl-CoA synthetase (AMP-forming)